VAYCDTIDPDSWSPGALIQTYFCGLQAAVTTPLAETAQSGQDTLAGLGQTAAETVQHGQDVLGQLGEDVTDAANPLNLFGALAGASFGGLLAVAGVGVVAALAADQLLAGGVGTAAVLRRVSGGSRVSR
jgi:hypothetical protein